MPYTKNARVISLTAGSLVVIGGGVSMLGWIAGIDRLTDWKGDGISIKLNPSICLTLLGLALVVMSYRPDRWLFGRILAGFAVLIAAATLFENLSGVDLGIDNLFVREAPGALATGSPGRMGLPASTTITLLGTAFFLSSFRKYRRAANVLGIAALCIALLSCLGYVFGSSMLYSIPKITGIAVQTAVMLVVLALGFIAVLPDVGIGAATWRNDAGGVVLRQMLLAVAAAPILLGLFVSLAIRSELFDLEFGIAVRTLVEIILFTGLIWWTARKANLAETQQIAEAKARADARTARLLIEAQDGERDRLARDLHDSIGAAVTGVRLALARYNLTHPGKDVMKKDLDAIAHQLEDLDDEVSTLAWQIKPAPLENLGLGAALKSVCGEWSARQGIEFECEISLEHQLPAEAEANMYRIVQEAVNNAVKHGKPNRIGVALASRPGSVVLSIEDDGIGFDQEGIVRSGKGFGLVGMRERAALVGGKLEIESQPGAGTTILVRLPVN